MAAATTVRVSDFAALAAAVEAACTLLPPKTRGGSPPPVSLRACRDWGLVEAEGISAAARVRVPATAAPEARITPDGRAFRQALRPLRGEGRLDVRGATLVVRADDQTSEVPIVAPPRPVEAPAYPSGGEIARADAGSLATAFDRVAHAAWDAKSGSLAVRRFALHGIYLEPDEGRLRVVATDGYRLATSVAAASQVAAAKAWGKGNLIPIVSLRAARLVSELAAIGGGGDCWIARRDLDVPALAIRLGNGVVATPGVDLRFPRWRDVFPKKPVPSAVVDADDLYNAALAVIESREWDDDGPRTEITIERGRATLRTLDPVAVKAVGPHRKLAARYAGGARKVYVNPRYIAEAVQHMVGPVVVSAWGMEQPMRLASPDNLYEAAVMTVSREKKPTTAGRGRAAEPKKKAER